MTEIKVTVKRGNLITVQNNQAVVNVQGHATGPRGPQGEPGNPVISVTTKTANYQILESDDIIVGDTTGGAISLTMPTAVGCEKVYSIKRIGTGSNLLTIVPQAGQQIEEDATLILNRKNVAVDLFSDGAGWRIK